MGGGDVVSIPNGIEFYTMLGNSIHVSSSFNSQRDRILLYYYALRVVTHLVSIPNGIEFYKFAFNIRSSRESFNSQRDRILRRR